MQLQPQAFATKLGTRVKAKWPLWTLAYLGYLRRVQYAVSHTLLFRGGAFILYESLKSQDVHRNRRTHLINYHGQLQAPGRTYDCERLHLISQLQVLTVRVT